MVNAQELEARSNRVRLEAHIDAARNVHQIAGINQPRPGFQQNAGINQSRVVEENRGEEGVVHPQRQPIAPRGRAQHPAHMMYVEDDADLDGAGATGAILLLTLHPGVKFTITSTMIQLLNLKAMRLGLFPLSLIGEETNWLNEMPNDSIRTWNDLKEGFLERFFPKSKEIQMKDEISTHKHLPGEAMSLNYVTKPIIDAVCGGSFMRKSFAESMQLLDEVSKNNRAWYTRDVEVGELGYTFELSAEQRKREEERDQDMAHLRTQIDLLTKHIVAKSKKVNVVRQQNRYEDQDLDLDEEANYLGTKGVSRIITLEIRVTISGIACRNYARDGQYDRPSNRDQGNWKNKDGYKNDHSGVYVPPGNRDRAGGSSSRSKLEDMMAKED
ncbi:hypothetical protein R3W88_004400 [Solanum pinnatisectum]|uniref:Retrotransposon gag domain-containing protein n=1 Tax=Solanum pinnatisectum TaxID=50273 RepID=A0AAV9KCT0_9SOLN|nr:hypothetical protein R3W88_004400 [Solanum pinnatisectum]